MRPISRLSFGSKQLLWLPEPPSLEGACEGAPDSVTLGRSSERTAALFFTALCCRVSYVSPKPLAAAGGLTVHSLRLFWEGLRDRSPVQLRAGRRHICSLLNLSSSPVASLQLSTVAQG